MAYKLVVSKEAHDDIDDIITYITHVLKNQQAAKGFLDDVERHYRSVIDNMCMYSLCSNVRLQRHGYRKIPIKNYLIIYRVAETEENILVVRVVYGARDYAKLL
jgi:plasmid stabilization system protein ParE